MQEGGSTVNIIALKERTDEVQAEESIPRNEKRIKRRHLISVGIKTVVLALVWAHFAWATYYFLNQKGDLDSTTCTGYGFWMILFIFVNFGVLYKLALKNYVIPLIARYAWNPCVDLLTKIPYGNIIIYVAVVAALVVYLVVDTSGERHRLVSLVGLAIYVVIGYALSSNRRMIPWKTVIWGLIFQFILGLIMIRWETGRNIFICIGDKATTFLNYALEGAEFVYGDDLVNKQAVFAFNSLAAIYLFGFVINVLFYYGIIQEFVIALGKALQWIMGTSICESVASVVNVFLGMSESPMLLKPYLVHLTKSELNAIMTSGFACVSGTVLAAYISFGASAADLITASVMSAPGALCYSKLMYPETEEVIVTKEKIKKIEVEYESVLDAASKGAQDASHIVIGIVANLIAFIAFVAFVNGVLTFLGVLVGFDGESSWTVELILGKVLIPLAYTMGVEWEDCQKVGQLIGIKTMVNEFVAFQNMQNMQLTPRSKTIATYSICGFANPGSVGIMLSALGQFMHGRKAVLSKLMLRSFVGGCVVCFITACIAGILRPENIDV